MLPQPKLLLDSVTGAGSATAAGTFTSAVIDRLGYDFVSIDIAATTQAASTQAGSPQSLKLSEGDGTSATFFSDVVGARGGSALGTNVDFVVGVGRTAGVNAYKMNVDCRGRKRYLQVAISPAATQTFQVSANGFRAEQSPSTAAKAGVLNLVEI